MNGLDWTDYMFQPAPRSLLCQFRRKEWAEIHVGYAKDFRPEFNVAGLEWKLTGIAREQLDQMPATVRTQVMPGASWIGVLTGPCNPLGLLFCSGCGTVGLQLTGKED